MLVQWSLGYPSTGPGHSRIPETTGYAKHHYNHSVFRGGFRGGAVAPPFGRWSALFSRAAGWTILTVIGLHATLSPGL